MICQQLRNKKYLIIDIETYCDLSLMEVGTYRYAEHESFRILVACVRAPNGKEWIFSHTDGIETDADQLARLVELLTKAVKNGYVLVAHNAEFERVCLQNYDWTIEDPRYWYCTMAHSRYLSIPAGLDGASKAVGLNTHEQKHQAGKRLIKRFSVPCEKLPPKSQTFEEDWHDFIEYCRQDVYITELLLRRLLRYPMPEREWTIWCVDQMINQNGLPIDNKFLNKLNDLSDEYMQRVFDKLKELTQKENPNSRDQLLDALHSIELDMPDLKKETVDEYINDPQTPKVAKTILKLRRELSTNSIKKIPVAQRAQNSDHRLRGTFLFYGANRTGRWSGKLVQPHNLPRNEVSLDEIGRFRNAVKTEKPVNVFKQFKPLTKYLTSSLRSIIAPHPGHKLVVYDFSSIESVMLAWATRCESMLSIYREGRDAYKEFATRVFNKPYDAIEKSERSFAKPAVLGCGYGLGYVGLQRYAEAMGIEMDAASAQMQVDLFRNMYPEVVNFWKMCDNKAKEAIKSPNYKVSKIFQADDLFMWINLPSKRRLYYYLPEIAEVEKFGNMQKVIKFASKSPTFKIETYGAKLCENIIQALSRDVLADSLVELNKHYKVIGHVHDEVILEVPEDQEDQVYDEVGKLLEDNIAPWAKGAPIRAEGYIADYYRKD